MANPAFHFDTLSYAKRLKEAGCNEHLAEVHAEEQAEVISMLINEQLATKTDIKHLEKKLDAESVNNKYRFDELHKEIQYLGTDLRKEMQYVDAELRKEMQQGDAMLRKEIQLLGTELRKEMQQGDATLRKEIQLLGTELRKEMQEGNNKLREEMHQLNTDVRLDIVKLQHEIKDISTWLLIKLSVVMITAVGLMHTYNRFI